MHQRPGQSITLKDVQAARVAYRRRLANEIREKTARAADYLPAVHRTTSPAPPMPKPAPASAPKRPRLRTYFEDD